MEKKQPGVCERLFHAFSNNPALQPIRRLTFRHQDPVHSTNSSAPPVLAHSSNTDKKHSAPAAKPQGSHAAAAGKKLHEAAANLKADLKHAQDLVASKVPAPAPPHKVTKPPKKELNQKMDEFITRTYGKIRTTSGVGKAPSK
ncbi:hypothetical protein M6B38_102895 [Iris pallida]|uniref:Uncharacterized protein n=1 Tax=Iris pallida TaxID=29817 RepID=A0AAX6G6D7_IRIPA|nr:hypothetical protein M6B38_203245 [Iris pallida]KAJ6824220.1 hypothetical protein M6B38_102895 [Iris pallida]